jgi:hypothetical protein
LKGGLVGFSIQVLRRCPGLADTVHRWYGPKKGVSIHAVEVDDSISQSWNFLPRNLGKVSEDHWAYRALGGDKREGTTIMDERELMEFLELEKSTFAILSVKLRNGEKNLYAYLGLELM